MLYDASKLLVVAGPSLLESEKVVLTVAQVLADLQKAHPNELKVVFKGAFDKPYRTNLYSARGNGMEEGLALLAEIKDQFNLPVLTDVHERYQVEPASAVCDAIQIPSVMARQNDLLVQAAKSGCVVNVRKAGTLSPQEMLPIAEKLELSHAQEVWLTERGSSFGYNNFIVDMRSFAVMKQSECPVLIDATATTPYMWQSPHKGIDSRELALPIAKAAIAAGADGIYLDLHPEPENALIDTGIQLPLNRATPIIEECLKLWRINAQK